MGGIEHENGASIKYYDNIGWCSCLSLIHHVWREATHVSACLKQSDQRLSHFLWQRCGHILTHRVIVFWPSGVGMRGTHREAVVGAGLVGDVQHVYHGHTKVHP